MDRKQPLINTRGKEQKTKEEGIFVQKNDFVKLKISLKQFGVILFGSFSLCLIVLITSALGSWEYASNI